jgi:hypothetical protein
MLTSQDTIQIADSGRLEGHADRAGSRVQITWI